MPSKVQTVTNEDSVLEVVWLTVEAIFCHTRCSEGGIAREPEGHTEDGLCRDGK